MVCDLAFDDVGFVFFKSLRFYFFWKRSFYRSTTKVKTEGGAWLVKLKGKARRVRDSWHEACDLGFVVGGL